MTLNTSILEKLLDIAYTKMYAEALPPGNYQKIKLMTEEGRIVESFKHYLEPKRREEILNETFKPYKINYRNATIRLTDLFPIDTPELLMNMGIDKCSIIKNRKQK